MVYLVCRAAPNPSNKQEMMVSSVLLGSELSSQSEPRCAPPAPEPEPCSAVPDPVLEPVEMPTRAIKKREEPAPEQAVPQDSLVSQVDLSIPLEPLRPYTPISMDWDGNTEMFRQVPGRVECGVIQRKSESSNPFNLPPQEKKLPIAGIPAPAASSTFPWCGS